MYKALTESTQLPDKSLDKKSLKETMIHLNQSRYTNFSAPTFSSIYTADHQYDKYSMKYTTRLWDNVIQYRNKFIIFITTSANLEYMGSAVWGTVVLIGITGIIYELNRK
jgi:hypothetical protein